MLTGPADRRAPGADDRLDEIVDVDAADVRAAIADDAIRAGAHAIDEAAAGSVNAGDAERDRRSVAARSRRARARDPTS